MSNSKYAAMSTLGLGLMQWGASSQDRALKAKTLKHEQSRNEKLDALAEKRATWADANTKEDQRLKGLQISSQTELNRTLGSLNTSKGANVDASTDTALLTNEVLPEKLDMEMNLLEGQVDLQDAKIALTTEQANDIQEARGTADMLAESKVLSDTASQALHEAQAGALDADKENLNRVTSLKEWVSGAKWNPETNSLEGDPLAAEAAKAISVATYAGRGSATPILQIAARIEPGIRAQAKANNITLTKEQISYIAIQQASTYYKTTLTDSRRLNQDAEYQDVLPQAQSNPWASPPGLMQQPGSGQTTSKDIMGS
jgi:hypothetical protein